MVQRCVKGRQSETPLSANSASCSHEVVDRILEAVGGHKSSDQRQIESDLRRLAHLPDGLHYLQEALDACADDDLGLMVRAYIYRIAADLTCQRNVYAHQIGLWTLSGAAVILAGAAVLFSATGWSVWYLWGLAGVGFALFSLGLAVAALWKWKDMTEIAKLVEMADGCKTAAQDTALEDGN